MTDADGTDDIEDDTKAAELGVRPVKLRLTLDVVMPVVQNWDADTIEFYYNGSSSCLDNLIDDIRDRYMGEGKCTCDIGKVEYVGEASPDEGA